MRTCPLISRSHRPERRFTRLPTSEEGWTFVETIIVIAIILILTGTVGFIAFRYINSAKEVAARSQIETFVVGVNAYLLDNGNYPTEQQGLAALWQKPTTAPIPSNWRGPYIQKPVPNDPWGHPYQYVVPGPNGLPFGIRSFGSDGLEGGQGNAKDITSWSQ